ncbi:GTP-binding protein [Clostridium oryzae]|uniref:Tetracycline resistance protein TetM n=1 Tax=Clostridium oryzae TaxID=1450648 RepID=A0A1V4ID89_9CLOT|nr:TetM/TetW/TetO/TetS family tetracycline resistance ribosomal protection protein [Clostridium oryzae]OPJ57906.1 tetracycline resistance protein TetM [Clostridium oryzae]
MNKTIGILAHVDAGKTTFTEQLLYNTKTTRKLGRVDHKDAFMDSHELEKERGITIFADQAVIEYDGDSYYIIDTPGHVDFSAEMERAVQVMDYAIIIISAVEGVEAHTETVWRILRNHHIPTFFFINKIDRAGADVERTILDIRENLTEDAVNIDDFQNNYISEAFMEFMADRDEKLLNEFLNGNVEMGVWNDALKLMIKGCRLFPCCSGSAINNKGIMEFFHKFHFLSPTEYITENEFSARVYKIKYDENNVRVTYMKILSGCLKVRDEISFRTTDGEEITEKVTQMRIYNGKKFGVVAYAEAGKIVGVTGISSAQAGDGIGTLHDKAIYEMVPTLKSRVIYPMEMNPKDALRCFRILEAEDPALNVNWEEKLQELNISVMGIIQLEVLEKLVDERFKFNVSFGKPEILYKETITSEVAGCGHFEPLKHYAEVHIVLQPNGRNKGITFESRCHVDDLSLNFQNLVKQHIFEKEHHGILTGSPITDIKVILTNGRSHLKHTSGGDFREATFRALRQALEKADNILLEPYYLFKIKVSIEHMGRVLSDIQKSKGSFKEPESDGNKLIVTGKVPVINFIDYSTELAEFTQGKGSINLNFGGYDICHNQQEVIEAKQYNKDADPEYSSASIFCSKGQAFSVAWQEAENWMHCL